jgi:group I intron endonuclease
MSYCIYKTTNLINGKFYIGKDENNKLWYLGSGVLIKKAIKKYGRENFIKTIIDTSNDKDELCKKERFWIRFYNSQDSSIGYNVADGGEGGFTGFRSEESKRKIGESSKGRISYWKGKRLSDETREKMSIAAKARLKNKENHSMFGKKNLGAAKWWREYWVKKREASCHVSF